MASKVAPARTADTMLKRIEAFLLSAPREEAVALWDVLSALRGPDDEDYALKGVTTERVRTLAFPAFAAPRIIHIGADFATLRDAQYLSDDVSLWSHFNYHIQRARAAFVAMGRLRAE